MTGHAHLIAGLCSRCGHCLPGSSDPHERAREEAAWALPCRSAGPPPGVGLLLGTLAVVLVLLLTWAAVVSFRDDHACSRAGGITVDGYCLDRHTVLRP